MTRDAAMNKPAIRKLIRWLQKTPAEMYDQRSYGWECGSPCCIAGHACLMEGGKGTNKYGIYRFLDKDGHAMQAAREILGLSNLEAIRLFDASGQCWIARARKMLKSAKATDRKRGAIMELRHLLRTGRVG